MSLTCGTIVKAWVMGVQSRSAERLMSVQTLLVWVVLGCVLLSSLALGANRPVSWMLLSMIVVLCGLLHLVIDAIVGVFEKSKLLLFIAILFLVTVSWGYVQTWGGMSGTLPHPFWQLTGAETGAISADPIRGQHHVMRLLTYGIVFWMTLRFCEDAFKAMSLLKVFGLFSTALALFGLYAMFTDVNAILGPRASGSTVNASFANRNAYATYAVFGFLANIVCYLKGVDRDMIDDTLLQRLRNFLERFFAGSWIFGLGAIICLVAVALTQSRAGAAAGVIGLLTFFLAYRLKGRGGSLSLGLTFIAIAGFVIFTSATGVAERLLTTTDENSRFAIYPKIIEGIWERPLLGHGLGAFLDAFRSHVPLEAANGEWDLAHNAYLENFYELGIPAASALYLALFLIAWTIWRGTRKRQRDRAYPCFALACIAAAAFHSVFDFSLQMPATAAVFAMILGLGWSQSIPTRHKRKTI